MCGFAFFRQRILLGTSQGCARNSDIFAFAEINVPTIAVDLIDKYTLRIMPGSFVIIFNRRGRHISFIVSVKRKSFQTCDTSLVDTHIKLCAKLNRRLRFSSAFRDSIRTVVGSFCGTITQENYLIPESYTNTIAVLKEIGVLNEDNMINRRSPYYYQEDGSERV